MTEIHLHNECAHVGLSIHAPVHAGAAAQHNSRHHLQLFGHFGYQRVELRQVKKEEEVAVCRTLDVPLSRDNTLVRMPLAR